MKLEWSDHGRPIRRATAEHNQIWYEVGFHFSQKCFYIEAQGHGRQIFFEYAKTLEDAKKTCKINTLDHTLFCACNCITSVLQCK